MAKRRFSANLGFLWRDLPFLDRIARAKAAGFDMVEFHHDAQAIGEGPVKAALAATGLPLVALNTPRGETWGLAALAGREAEARAEIDAAVELCATLGGRFVHVMAGITEPDRAAIDRLSAAYAYAAERAADRGIGILAEPISKEAAPGYVLSDLDRAADILAALDAPNLKILFDCYHVHRMADDVADAFRRVAPLVGHVQIAAVDTRQEPSSGPVDYAVLLPALEEAGYAGPYGAEYLPRGAVEDGLGWLATLRAA